MSITMHWDGEDQTILVWDCAGEWTVEDLKTAVVESRQRIETVKHTVHILVDARESQPSYKSFLGFGRRVSSDNPPNRGMTVLVGPSGFMRVLYDVFVRVYGSPRTFAMVETLDEARALIRERQAESGL